MLAQLQLLATYYIIPFVLFCSASIATSENFFDRDFRHVLRRMDLAIPELASLRTVSTSLQNAVDDLHPLLNHNSIERKTLNQECELKTSQTLLRHFFSSTITSLSFLNKSSVKCLDAIGVFCRFHSKQIINPLPIFTNETKTNYCFDPLLSSCPIHLYVPLSTTSLQYASTILPSSSASHVSVIKPTSPRLPLLPSFNESNYLRSLLVSLSKAISQSNVSVVNVDGIHGRYFSALAHWLPLSHVSKLSLNDIYDSDKALVNITMMGQLKEVVINSSPLSRRGIEVLASMSRRLDRMVLKRTRLGSSGFEKLVSGLDESGIRELSVTVDYISVLSKETITKLQKSNVEVLDLSHINLLPSSTKALSKILERSQIRKLSLDGNVISMMNMTRFSKLTHLSLSRSYLHYNVLYSFFSFLPSSNLVSFKLDYTGINSKSMPRLARVLPRTKLTSLSLNWNTFSSDALEKLLASLPSTLRSLSLARTLLDGDSVPIFCNYLPETNVDELDLDMNAFGMYDVRYLVVCLQRSRIRKVHVMNGMVRREMGKLVFRRSA